jgi:hypothetical protein
MKRKQGYGPFYKASKKIVDNRHEHRKNDPIP